MSETSKPTAPPSNFTDPDGNVWRLRLTYGLTAEAKRDTGVDIGAVTKSDNAWVQFLFGDPEKLVGLLWVLCQEQAKERGVTPERFAYLFDGRTLEAAGMALAGAVADFFPRSQVGAAIRESLAQILDATDAKAVAVLKSQTETYCKSAENSQESPGSTPAG